MAFDHLVFPVHHSDLPRFCLVLHEGENSHGASQDLVSDLIQHVLDMSIKVFFWYKALFIPLQLLISFDLSHVATAQGSNHCLSC